MANFFRAFVGTGVSNQQPAQTTTLPAFSTGNPGDRLAINPAGNGLIWVDVAGGTPYGYKLAQPVSTGQILVSTGPGNALTANVTRWMNRGAAGMYLRMDSTGNNLEWGNAPVSSGSSGGGATTPTAPDKDSRLPQSPGANRVLVTSASGDVHSSSESLNVTAGDSSYWSAAGFVGDSLSIAPGGSIGWIKKQNALIDINASTKQQLLIAIGTGTAQSVTGNEVWLNAGNAGQILSSNGTGFAWITPAAASSASLPSTTTTDQILISTGAGNPLQANVTSWMAKGLNGQSLSMNGGSVVWRDKQDTLANINSNNKAQLLMAIGSGTSRNAAGTEVWFDAGAAGKLLSSNGTVFQWVDPPASTGTYKQQIEAGVPTLTSRTLPAVGVRIEQPALITGTDSAIAYKFAKSTRTYAKAVTAYKFAQAGATTSDYSAVNNDISLINDQRLELKELKAPSVYAQGYNPQYQSNTITMSATNGTFQALIASEFMVSISTTVKMSIDKTYVEGQGFTYSMATGGTTIPTGLQGAGYSTNPTVGVSLSLLITKPDNSKTELKGDQNTLFLTQAALWYESITGVLKGTFYVSLGAGDIINGRLYWGNMRGFAPGKMILGTSKALTDHIFVRELATTEDVYL